jgi:hypothetical protein
LITYSEANHLPCGEAEESGITQVAGFIDIEWQEERVEVQGTGILFTLAEIMVTFAGFSTLLVSVRQVAGAPLSPLDRLLAKMVLVHLMVLTGGALLPSLLSLFDLPEVLVWQVAAVIFAVPKLLLLLTYPYRRRQAVGQRPPVMFYVVFVGFGSLVVMAMLVYVLAGFKYAAAAYITALVLNFFICASAFVMALDVIMGQQKAASL